MRRVLFVLPSYSIGGTVVSTFNLMSLLDREMFDVCIMAMNEKGELKDLFNDFEHLQTNFIFSALSAKSWSMGEKIYGKILFGIIRKLSHIKYIERLFIKWALPFCDCEKKFDTIVACEEGIATRCVANSKCKNKIAWIRCDYQKYLDRNNQVNEIDVYSQFNRIICVSEYTLKNFQTTFPSLALKALCVYNPQNVSFLQDQADKIEKEDRFLQNGRTILSIGRCSSPVKRFTYIPKIAADLKKRGIDFIWYVVGPYNEKDFNIMQDLIRKFSVEGLVILLGAKTNPHFYIKHSDLLVSLSETEACPRVINEAKILGTPTVCTDFPTAKEYITNRKDGMIAPIEQISESIVEILQNKQLYATIKSEILKFRFDNHDIMDLIGEIL